MASDADVMRFSGMTVNERLHEAKLLDVFDRACRARERDEILRLLLEVHLTPADAASSADAILKDPKRYGY
jgi:hypothetical protein